MRQSLNRYRLVRFFKKPDLSRGMHILDENGQWVEKTDKPMYFSNTRKASDEAYKHYNPRQTFIMGPQGGKYRPHKPLKEDFKKKRYQSGGENV